ncbi:MAG TPA: hypothetical protein VG498_25805, partial [Terriglobales bacterium]|nr:hypothetical protein [Terriglobales bacterium]
TGDQMRSHTQGTILRAGAGFGMKVARFRNIGAREQHDAKPHEPDSDESGESLAELIVHT